MLGDYDFETLLKNKTLPECKSFIKDYVEDMYLVPGGYKVKDITLLGTTSPVGFLGNYYVSSLFPMDKMIFQFIRSGFCEDIHTKQRRAKFLYTDIYNNRFYFFTVP